MLLNTIKCWLICDKYTDAFSLWFYFWFVHMNTYWKWKEWSEILPTKPEHLVMHPEDSNFGNARCMKCGFMLGNDRPLSFFYNGKVLPDSLIWLNNELSRQKEHYCYFYFGRFLANQRNNGVVFHYIWNLYWVNDCNH